MFESQPSTHREPASVEEIKGLASDKLVTRDMIIERLGTATIVLGAGTKCSLGTDSGLGIWEVVGELLVDVAEIRPSEDGFSIIVGSMHNLRLVDAEQHSTGLNGSNTISFSIKRAEASENVKHDPMDQRELLYATTEEAVMKKIDEAIATNGTGVNVTGTDNEIVERVAARSGWVVEKVELAGLEQTFLKKPPEKTDLAAEGGEYPESIVINVGDTHYGFKNLGMQRIPGEWRREAIALELPNEYVIYWSDQVQRYGFDYPSQTILWDMSVSDDNSIILTRRQLYPRYSL